MLNALPDIRGYEGTMQASRETYLRIAGLEKRFGDTRVYNALTLDIMRGEVVSIFGPNGCGKSTLIGILSGIIEADGGSVSYGGKTLRDTRIGYVFQNYREALFPWMSARQNIHYPLKIAGIPARERDERVERLISLFDVSFDLGRYPYQLSGGQQQLVSIMRALVVDPDILFLDEPFSSLDYEMTLFVREQLQKALHLTNMTTILVSHDLEEAVYLADRVILLSRNPSRVVDIVPVPLAWPRQPEVVASEQFVALRARTLETFRKELRN